MISWMQKHHKYLVITIWIATIAFIGAGFFGWGSYQYGSKAGSIAQVGDIDIDRAKFDLTYSNLYQRYNQSMDGKLDDKKAEELGLDKQAFSSLAAQARLLNLAKEFGIIVSEDELAKTVAGIPAFQNNGTFDKEIYQSFLQNRRLQAKTFENLIRDEILIEKMMALLESQGMPFEKEILSSALNVSDKIAYKVLTQNDVNITINDEKLKQYFEAHKSAYKTPKMYQLDILWTQSSEANVTQEEISEFFKQNSFNYRDANGKQMQLEQAKQKITADLKMQKTKKEAQKNYIAFRKDALAKSETLSLSIHDPLFDTQTWKEIERSGINTILKPKAVQERYATVKIASVEEPKEMDFDQARPAVIVDYQKDAASDELVKLAQSTLKNFQECNATVSDFLTLDTPDNLKPLNIQESLQFLQKLFTSIKEKDIIMVSDKAVVYAILEQRMVKAVDLNTTNFVNESIEQLKRGVFQANLLKNLDQKYETKFFVEGLEN